MGFGCALANYDPHIHQRVERRLQSSSSIRTAPRLLRLVIATHGYDRPADHVDVDATAAPALTENLLVEENASERIR